jgi:hypothetical protein
MKSSKSINVMHRYVIVWGGLMAAVAITLPVAMLRVSATSKFTGQPLISYDCASNSPDQRTITSFWACFQLQVEPLTPRK